MAIDLQYMVLVHVILIAKKALNCAVRVVLPLLNDTELMTSQSVSKTTNSVYFYIQAVYLKLKYTMNLMNTVSLPR